MDKSSDFTMAFIGVGNMGEALLGGVIRSGITNKEHIIISDASGEQVEKISSLFGVRAAVNNTEAVQAADVILLGVKPQTLPAIKDELCRRLTSSQLVISILAGVTVSKLQDALGPEPTIVRVMPNLPALIGAGMSAVASDFGDQRQIKLVESILGTVGDVVCLPESLIDAVTAMSGSGPGYVYLFVEAMAEAGEKIGLPRQAARKMAEKTFIGACQLLETSGESPEELRRRVTSPGGTTEAGIRSFEEQGLREVFITALKRSTERAEELGRG